MLTVPKKRHRTRRISSIGKATGTAGLVLAAIATATSSGATTTTADYQTVASVEAVDVTTVARLLPNLPAPAVKPPVYTNDLDGWIRQALDIMRANNIPGSYESIHRNIMRESTGNPQAINLYDSNAAAGIPSKGLLQVIDPTFQAYHVEGTSTDIYDPVANIVAACNYAAHRYGSMDNVNSAY